MIKEFILWVGLFDSNSILLKSLIASSIPEYCYLLHILNCITDSVLVLMFFWNEKNDDDHHAMDLNQQIRTSRSWIKFLLLSSIVSLVDLTWQEDWNFCKELTADGRLVTAVRLVLYWLELKNSELSNLSIWGLNCQSLRSNGLKADNRKGEGEKDVGAIILKMRVEIIMELSEGINQK